MKKKIWLPMATIIGLVFLGGFPVSSTADEFYQGKTIRFIVGYAPGGGYDTYTRAVARHISKHIPGNPATLVENMEGAGSLLAANYLYKNTEPDGLTLGNWNSLMIMQQALGSKGIKFDARKFEWIGAPSKSTSICAVMAFTGLKNFDDVLVSKKEIKLGATRAGSTTDDLPKLMNVLMGTKLKVISGYKGTAKIRVAMQRREVDGACWGWESMRVTARAMLDAKGDDRLIPFIMEGRPYDQELKGLPQFTQVIKGKENLAAFKVWVKPKEFERPLMLPPKTPNERVHILRKAFKETLQDSEFLAEAKKSKLVIEHVPGKDIEEYVDEILSIPSGAKEKLRFLVAPVKKK